VDDNELSRPVILPAAAAISLLGAILTIWTAWSYYQGNNQQEKNGYARAEEQAEHVVQIINNEMQTEMILAQDVADKLSSGEVPFAETEIYMQEVFSQNSELLGLGVGFTPYAYQPDVQFYGPYLLRDAQGNHKQVLISYNYTDPSLSSAGWFTQAMEKKAGVWVDPYYGKSSEDTVFTYSVPFQAPGSESYAGVVVIVQSVTNTFKRFAQNVDLGFGGYLFLVNAENEITFHPEAGLISKSVSEVSNRIAGFNLEEALSSSVAESNFKGEIVTQTTQSKTRDTTWFFIRSLSTPPGWKAVVVISSMDQTYDPHAIIRKETNIYLAFLVFAIGLGMLLFRVDRMTAQRLMAFSVWVGFLFLAGILLLWTLTYRYPELNHQKVLINDAGIDRVLGKMNIAFNDVSAPNPEKIPTGILIENMTMTPHSVKVSGYLWQKYPPGFPEEDINFPQLTDQVGALFNEEVYHYTQNNQRVVGWFFSTEIQQRFDIGLYPLDQAIIKIQIEPSKLSSQYVLVPSILDYDYMSPSVKPGLDRILTVKGWTIRNSFFTYSEADYGTSFGLFRQISKDSIPNLVFNVRMNRNILSPIIAYCIVIYIVVMQVYGLSILRIDNAYQVMSIAAALFLVVAITHTGMRDTLVVTGVVYLEYFFILLYLTILATSINAFMNAANVPVFFLTYRDNLMIKVLFWPTFLGIGLVCTLLTFYPK
jgi:hypothetical protein